LIRPEDLPGLLAERNESVRGHSQLANAYDARTGYLVRSFLPSLNFEAASETFQTGPYPMVSQLYGSAEARINLFRGGRDLLENRVRAAEAQGVRAESDRSRSEEMIEARRAYWALVFLREQIATLEAALRSNASHLASANRRIQRGLTTDTDRLDFEIQRSQLKEELESARHLGKQTQIRLRAVLGFSSDVEFDTIPMAPHEEEDALREASFQTDEFHQALAARSSAEISDYRRTQAHLWWLPTVDAYAGYYRYTLRERDYLSSALRDDTALGIRLTLNIDPVPAVSAARSASMEAEARNAIATQALRAGRSQLEVAQESMKHEHDLTHEAETRVAQGESYLAKTLSEYDRGLKNAPDVLGASQRLLGFKIRFAEIRRDYQLAKSELLFVVGR
jgi:outer membrane protein TolC